MKTGGDWIGVIKDLKTDGFGGGAMILGVDDLVFGRRGLSPESDFLDFSESESLELMLSTALA